MKGKSTNTAPPGAARVPVVDAASRIPIADAVEGMSGRIDAQALQLSDGAGHEALPAGLVDGAHAGLKHDGLKAREPCADRRGEPDRPAADNGDVSIHAHDGEVSRRLMSARFSVGIRKPRSRIALRIVKTRAVIHAVCTSGNAMPSIATIQ